jgi:hypothetical protein
MAGSRKQRDQPVQSATHADALVIGPGWLSDGDEVWAVQSRSPGCAWYRVTLRADDPLTSTCPGASFGKTCWHRRAGADRLLHRAEWERVLQLRESTEEEAARRADAVWVRYREHGRRQPGHPPRVVSGGKL